MSHLKRFNFGYYPPESLVMLMLIAIAFIIGGKYLVTLFFTEETPSFIAQLIWIISSSATLVFLFKLINEKLMWKPFLGWLKLPDLRGKYEGKLISGYHVDDDPDKPHVTKWVRLEIHQNLNGFYVEAHFYDTQKSTKESSVSYSISHQILSKDNEEFIIRYGYNNTPNEFHPHHKKYKLNKVEGMCELTFNPQTTTLKGHFFGNGADRASHGKMELKRKEDE